MDDDQTKWSEADWKAFIDGLLGRLSHYTSSLVEVGSFWMVANPHEATFNARLRAAGALPELACEAWEGALSVLASPGQISISVDVFAFEAGHRKAPADQHWWTSSATTSGFVLAACSGVRSQAIFGLTITTSPREMNRCIPPSSWRAR